MHTLTKDHMTYPSNKIALEHDIYPSSTCMTGGRGAVEATLSLLPEDFMGDHLTLEFELSIMFRGPYSEEVQQYLKDAPEAGKRWIQILLKQRNLSATITSKTHRDLGREAEALSRKINVSLCSRG